jgi:hypothetical protein
MRLTAAALSLLPGLASAWQAAAYQGMNLVFSDEFNGGAGQAPNPSVWNIAGA